MFMMTNNNRDKYLMRKELKQQIKSDRGWYFITFLRELPPNRPYGFTLFNEPFVLFRDKNDDLVCYLLSDKNDMNQKNSIKIKSFAVMQKQGEIWFYRGKL